MTIKCGKCSKCCECGAGAPAREKLRSSKDVHCEEITR
jgi:hypothetical protein